MAGHEASVHGGVPQKGVGSSVGSFVIVPDLALELCSSSIEF